MTNYFTCNINQFPSYCGRIRTCRYDIRTNILLKRLKHKITQKHCIIPRCIGIEFQKGQCFMAKIFQGSIGKLITPSCMITGKYRFGGEIFLCTSQKQHSVDFHPHSNIGINHCVRSATGKIKLRAIIHQPTIQGPTEPLPTATFAPKFDIFPDIFTLAVMEWFPMRVRRCFCYQKFTNS